MATTPDSATHSRTQLTGLLEQLALDVVLSDTSTRSLGAWREALGGIAATATSRGCAAAAEEALRLSRLLEALPPGAEGAPALLQEGLGRMQDILAAAEPAPAGPAGLEDTPPEPAPPPAPATPPAALNMALSDDPELLADFILEADEHLQSIERNVLAIEQDPGCTDAIHATFRAFHTIKGLAGFLEFTGILEVAHQTETLLDMARNGTLVLHPPVIDVILESADYLGREVRRIDNARTTGCPTPDADNSTVLAHVAVFLQESPEEPADQQLATLAQAVQEPESVPPAPVAPVAPSVSATPAVPAAASEPSALAPVPAAPVAPAAPSVSVAPAVPAAASVPSALAPVPAAPVAPVAPSVSVAPAVPAAASVPSALAPVPAAPVAPVAPSVSATPAVPAAASEPSALAPAPAAPCASAAPAVPAAASVPSALAPAPPAPVAPAAPCASAAPAVPAAAPESSVLAPAPSAPVAPAAPCASAAPAVPAAASVPSALAPAPPAPVAPAAPSASAAPAVPAAASVPSALAPAPVAPVAPSVSAAPAVPAAAAGSSAPAPAPSAPAGDGQQSKGATGSSVKVDTAKLDFLINMVGEMVIAQSLVRHSPDLAQLQSAPLQRNIAQLSRITDEVQKTAMAMRMVPVSVLFQKMARLVRDLSRKSGKQAELITVGEDTEIDRNIVEVLADPLMHMIRNSMDHGIEPPAGRAAAGKPPVARVELRASHQAGSILIEISDDGRGLDRDVILNKARERGVVAADAELSDSEIYNLIFEPGFSTAAQVTDISGRGVGMDVVKRHIQKLRGHVEVSTVLGRGTTFGLRLPLTLAIIDGLIVGVGKERYIVPLFAIKEMLRPSPGMVTTVEGKREIALVRNRVLPVIRLYRRFGVEPRTHDPEDSLLILTESQGKEYCLMVDSLMGKQEVVIKSLGDTFKEIAGIAGGAILGDGRVGLILDMNALLSPAAKR